jgi:hypothetical protein
VGREVARARRQITGYVDEVISELKPELVVGYTRALTTRIKAPDKLLREADAARDDDHARRKARVTAMELQVDTVRAQREELDALVRADR